MTHVRSTVLQSSLAGLKERGHFTHWCEKVVPATRAVILEAVGPAWLDVGIAQAHYEACEALQLPHGELVALSEALGARVQGTFLASMTKAAKQAGVTPWIAVPHFGRLWGRLFQGGSMQMAKAGPKDIALDVKGLALVQIPYFRVGYTSIIRAALLLFGARSAYVKITRYRAGSDELSAHASWV